MIEILTQLGQGNTVSITPIHAELTTQEAADILNMSRPTFVKLLDTRAIPYSRKEIVGKLLMLILLLIK